MPHLYYILQSKALTLFTIIDDESTMGVCKLHFYFSFGHFFNLSCVSSALKYYLWLDLSLNIPEKQHFSSPASA